MLLSNHDVAFPHQHFGAGTPNPQHESSMSPDGSKVKAYLKKNSDPTPVFQGSAAQANEDMLQFRPSRL